MEHMTPKVVEVPLPGVRPNDVVPVTTFDFVSQLHSLSSDTELNCPSNLVINPNNWSTPRLKTAFVERYAQHWV
jgi:hypothetical protein